MTLLCPVAQSVAFGRIDFKCDENTCCPLCVNALTGECMQKRQQVSSKKTISTSAKLLVPVLCNCFCIYPSIHSTECFYCKCVSFQRVYMQQSVALPLTLSVAGSLLPWHCLVPEWNRPCRDTEVFNYSMPSSIKHNITCTSRAFTYYWEKSFFCRTM